MSYSIADIKIGDVIRFTSLSNSDDNIYYGKVISKCSYDLAKTYGDLTAMFNNVGLYIDNSGVNIEDLHYILVKLIDLNDGDKFIIPFAIEWIHTITLVETENKTLVMVYEAGENDQTKIITALKDAGYIAKIERIY